MPSATSSKTRWPTCRACDERGCRFAPQAHTMEPAKRMRRSRKPSPVDAAQTVRALLEACAFALGKSWLLDQADKELPTFVAVFIVCAIAGHVMKLNLKPLRKIFITTLQENFDALDLKCLDRFKEAEVEACACGKVISLDASFCKHCGKQAPSARICRCGYKNECDANFCERCGTALTAEATDADNDEDDDKDEQAKAKAQGVASSNDSGENSETRLWGQIKTFNPHTGSGFIRSAEIARNYGQDAFFDTHVQGGVVVGGRVSFVIAFNARRQPQARNVKLEVVGLDIDQATTSADQISAKARVADWRPIHSGEPVVMRGHVNAYNQARGYGFIVCPDIQHSFGGKDVYMSRTQIQDFEGGMEPNQEVEFHLNVDSNGQPQARHVVKINKRVDQTPANEKAP